MNANERFEYMAEQFYKKTGMLAPGKDCPAELTKSEEGMHEAYKEWAIFTEQFHANLFKTHADMYEMLERLVNNSSFQSNMPFESEEIESLLKRARGE